MVMLERYVLENNLRLVDLFFQVRADVVQTSAAQCNYQPATMPPRIRLCLRGSLVVVFVFACLGRLTRTAVGRSRLMK